MENFEDFKEIKLNDFLNNFDEIGKMLEIPTQMSELTDGREIILIGDPIKLADYNHPQGENKLGFKSTCGLVSCEDILHQFDIHITENTIVQIASRTHLCRVNESNPIESGGTTIFDQKELLKMFDIPAHTELINEFESLASYVEQGKGIIIETNAGVLWDDERAYDTGGANHAIVVTGVARNPDNGKIEGFFINDSGRGYPEDSGRFVEVEILDEAWLQAGGMCVVTDIVRN